MAEGKRSQILVCWSTSLKHLSSPKGYARGRMSHWADDFGFKVVERTFVEDEKVPFSPNNDDCYLDWYKIEWPGDDLTDELIDRIYSETRDVLKIFIVDSDLSQPLMVTE